MLQVKGAMKERKIQKKKKAWGENGSRRYSESMETQSKEPAQDDKASQWQLRALMSSILRDKIEQEDSGASR